ncbi:hypothetical protein Tco_0523043, partial [Tanacetum coccineum]
MITHQQLLPQEKTDVENNWASALASSYEPPAENSLLAKTGDMMTFLNWYCRQINKSKLTQADLEGQAYEVVKGSMPVLSISKMKAARYPDFSLELLVPEQIWIEDVISIIFLFIKRMLSTAVKLWTRNLVIRQRVEDFQLGIESYQTQLNLTKPGWDATGYEFKHDYTSLSLLEHFRNSDEYNHDPEKCEHVGLKVTTSHEGNNTTRMIWRFTMADDLKEMLQRSHKSKELMLKATTVIRLNSVQPPPQPSSVQPTATTPPTQPVQTTSSPQIPSPSFHDTEGPSFEPSYHMSPPPSYEPEIQVLYERYKKQDQTFVAIGSEEDERAIKKINEKDADKEEEKKDESVHEEVQVRKFKRKKEQRKGTPDEDKVIDVESLDHQYPIVEWQSFFLTTKPQYDQSKPDEDIYLNKVTRSNGHQRFFRTLMGVLSILDREDLKVIYELVMEEYKD